MSEKKLTVFIDPLTDFGCKKLFGPGSTPASLIDFLNNMLDLDHLIVEIEYISTEHLGELEADRKSILDMHCRDDQGNYVIIEVQRVKQEFFKDRSLVYSTYPLRAQVKKGRNWDFQLKKIYTVCLLDFSFDDTHPEKVVHNVKLIEQDTQTVFSDRLTYCYIELNKFKKTAEELKTRRDQWLYVLKNLHIFSEIPVFLEDDPVFKHFFMDAETANLMEHQLMAYYAEMKEHWDRYAIRTTAEREVARAKEAAAKEAEAAEKRAEVAEKNLDAVVKEMETVLKEKEVAVEEAKSEGKIEFVRNLLQQTSLTVEQIAQSGNIPVSFVLDIQRKLN